MKTAMKKLFSLMLVAVLLISAVPFYASAATLTVDYGFETDSHELAYGDPMPAIPASPTREGYDFDGWWYDGQKINPNDFSTYPFDYDAEITAKWTPKQYTVKLDAAGGTFGDGTSSKTIPATFGQSVVFTDVPTRENYTFDGWYYGSIPVSSGDTYGVADNMDVEAHWRANLCNECGQPIGDCICCDTCHNYPCECLATVEVVINNAGTGKSFEIAAGKSVAEVHAEYNTKDYAKEGTYDPALTLAGTDTRVNATEAGKTYQLWLSWTEPTPDPATILIRAKKASDAGYPDGGSFTVAAGTHGVTAIFEAANYSGNVEGYSVSDSEGNGVRRAGENIELAEGGTYILWIELKEESSGNTGSGVPGTPAPSDPVVEKVTLTIDPNFKGAKTYSQKFEKGAKMSDVLKAVGIPSRKGYKFAGWHWDERGRDPVSNREVLSGNDTIYAQWDRKEKAEIILKIYVNGNTESAAKIVDMYEYARDNEIEISEAKEVVKKYYTAKDADGMTIYGVFDSQNWKAFVRNKNHDGAKSLDINRDEDTVVYVMVHNVKTYSTSTAKADASNPKTGDMIYNAAIIMVASVGSLATLYYLNKKRGIQ